MTEWFNEEQAAAELGMSLSELHWRRWKRQITFSGRGKLVRFKKEWLDAYIERQTRVSKWDAKAKDSSSGNSSGRKGSGISPGASKEKPTAEVRARQAAMKLKNIELPSSFKHKAEILQINHSR